MDFDRIRREKTRIIIENKFEPADIICSYVPVKTSFDIRERSCIENEWIEASKSKQFLFDGQLFHVKNQEVWNSKIKFSMYKSSFKEYLGTNNSKFKRLFNSSNVIRPISVGTMIITSDNKWIIGKRLGTKNYKGYYSLIAGYMDPSKDLINSKPDPFFAINREIQRRKWNIG